MANTSFGNKNIYCLERYQDLVSESYFVDQLFLIHIFKKVFFL